MTPLHPRGANFRFTCAQPRAGGASGIRVGRNARSVDLCKRRMVVLRAADNTTSERLTVDMRQFVEETQKNILELNKSRLKALEEASQERKKLQLKDATISDLMSKIAQLEAENMELREKISMSSAIENRSDIPPKAPPVPTPAPTPPAPQQQHHQQQQQQQKQQQQGQQMASTPTPARPPPPPAAVQPVASSNAGTIALHYATGWPDVFLHFNADNKGWSKSPGKRMDLGPRGFFISIDASKVEFVLTNGKNEWDRPNPYSQKPTNYFIDGPGEYILKHGRVHKI